MHKLVFGFIFLLITVLLSSFSVSNSDSLVKESNFMKSDTITWKQLANIKFALKKHPSYGEINFPIVNSDLKKLANKKIVVKGFIVPIDNKTYAISKNVFASCFFCGKAGPETIMGIKFAKATPKLKTDLYVTLEGTFRYNENDADDWIYHIENAVIVKSN